jgi:membrane protease YdiL (CAAX protease family)
VLFVIAGLLAPIGEEILFRGLLLRALRRHLLPEVAIAVSALIFAVSHLLDASLGTVAILPALFALGVISGIAATVVGDLSVSIPLHVGFNLVTLAAYAVVR